MSEMLGNRYFLARQFNNAIPYLEEALNQNPTGEKVKKKLIICNIQTGHIDKAFTLFYELVHNNPKVIIETDAYWDDCPCGELIPLWEKKVDENKDSLEYLITLGMLNLYCNLEKSRLYFNQAIPYSDNPAKIQSVLGCLDQV